MDLYVNDHLAGATLGTDLAQQIRDRHQGTPLESLVLGVEGKACLWMALKEVVDDYPSLGTTNLDELLERAETQKGILERERAAAGKQALHVDPESERVNPYSAENPPTSDDRATAATRG
jgi:hypothetical protein